MILGEEKFTFWNQFWVEIFVMASLPCKNSGFWEAKHIKCLSKKHVLRNTLNVCIRRRLQSTPGSSTSPMNDLPLGHHQYFHQTKIMISLSFPPWFQKVSLLENSKHLPKFISLTSLTKAWPCIQRTFRCEKWCDFDWMRTHFVSCWRPTISSVV